MSSTFLARPPPIHQAVIMKIVFLFALASLASCRSILPGGDRAKNVELEYTYIDEFGKPIRVKVQTDLINLSGVEKVEGEKPRILNIEPKVEEFNFEMDKPEPVVQHVFAPVPTQEPEFRYVVQPSEPKTIEVEVPEPEVRTVYVQAPAPVPVARKLEVEAPEPRVVYVQAPEPKTVEVEVESPEPKVVYLQAPQPRSVELEVKAPEQKIVYLQAPEPKTVEVDIQQPQRFVVPAPSTRTVKIEAEEPEVRTVYIQAPAPRPEPQVRYVTLPAPKAKSLKIETPSIRRIAERKSTNDDEYSSGEK